MVLNNVVDAAAVDSNVLSLWLSEHQEHAEELHVMCSWGPWPIQPIVVNTRLDGMKAYALVLQFWPSAKHLSQIIGSGTDPI